jgi:radical SAM superfamily enzyme YgiQ (UPF0313 family)
MLFSARGCPYKCSFCINATYRHLDINGVRLRRRSVDNVISELRQVKEKLGYVYIQVEDEIFTFKPEWVKEFSDRYQAEIGLPFWCYTHPLCCREDMIADLKRAGLRYIVMGIQSGSERLNREVYHRPTSREKIIESLWLLDQMDVVTCCDLLSNNPLETEEDRIATAHLLHELPSRILLFLGKVVVYPGSPLYEQVKHLPYPPTVDESLYRFWNSVYEIALYENLTLAELDELIASFRQNENYDLLEQQALALMGKAARLTEERLQILEKKHQGHPTQSMTPIGQIDDTSPGTPSPGWRAKIVSRLKSLRRTPG